MGAKLPDAMVRDKTHQERGRSAQVREVAARWAAIVAVSMGTGLMLFDAVGGPGVKYVGILAAAPFLAAIFARPRTVIVVGLYTIALAYVYGFLRGVDNESVQWVRLVAITLATGAAALSAKLRWRVDERLSKVTHVAETAQRALLRSPDPIDGLDVAVRYISAQAQSRIGGDVYEVLETEHGVRVLLGDVRGKGLPAVRLGSDVLGAFRYLAHAQPDLCVVARELDQVVARGGGDEDFVTAVLAEVKGDRVQLVNCGHPNPLLVCATEVKEVEVPDKFLPLGMGDTFESLCFTVRPDQRLLFYTDGLMEARNKDGAFFDLESGAALLRGAGLEVGVDRVFRALGEHVEELDDDVAVMVLATTRS